MASTVQTLIGGLVQEVVKKCRNDEESVKLLKRELAQHDFVLRKSSSEDPVACVWTSLLQKLTGRFDLSVDLNKNSDILDHTSDWTQLTESYNSTLPINRKLKEPDISLLQKCHSLQDYDQVDWAGARPGDDLAHSLNETVKLFPNVSITFYVLEHGVNFSLSPQSEEGPLGHEIFFLKSGYKLRQILPRRTASPHLPDYLAQLSLEILKYDLIGNWCEQVVEDIKGRSSQADDGLSQLYGKYDLLKILKDVQTVTELIKVLNTVSESTNASVPQELKFFEAAEAQLPNDSTTAMTEHIMRMKVEIGNKFKEKLQAYLFECKADYELRADINRVYYQRRTDQVDAVNRKVREREISLNLQAKSRLEILTKLALEDEPLRRELEVQEWATFLEELRSTRVPYKAFTGVFGSLEGRVCFLVAGLGPDAKPIEERPFLLTRIRVGRQTDSAELSKVLSRDLSKEPGPPDSPQLLLSGQNVVLSDVVREYLSQPSPALKEIRLTVKNTLYIDTSLTQPGVNLVVVAKFAEVTGPDQRVLDVSGFNGEPYSLSAMTPDRAGNHGKAGDDGKAGEAAGRVYIDVKCVLSGLEHLRILAKGGRGGDGQAGGDGMDGNGGEDGDPAVEVDQPSWFRTYCYHSKGTDGKAGGKGGRAGKGGRGGLPGPGGSIFVRCGQDELDSPEFEAVDGGPGKQGERGKPGAQGLGGKNFPDVAWTKLSIWWWDKWIRTRNKRVRLAEKRNFGYLGYYVAEEWDVSDRNTIQIEADSFVVEYSNEKAQEQISPQSFLCNPSDLSSTFSQESTSIPTRLGQVEMALGQLTQPGHSHNPQTHELIEKLRDNQEITSSLLLTNSSDTESLRRLEAKSRQADKEQAHHVEKLSFYDSLNSNIEELHKTITTSITTHQHQQIRQAQAHLVSKPRKNQRSVRSRTQSQPHATFRASEAEVSPHPILADIQPCFENAKTRPGLKMSLETCFQKCFSSLTDPRPLIQPLNEVLRCKSNQYGDYDINDYISTVLPKNLQCLNAVASSKEVMIQLYQKILPREAIPDSDSALELVHMLRSRKLSEEAIAMLEVHIRTAPTSEATIQSVLQDVYEQHVMRFAEESLKSALSSNTYYSELKRALRSMWASTEGVREQMPGLPKIFKREKQAPSLPLEELDFELVEAEDTYEDTNVDPVNRIIRDLLQQALPMFEDLQRLDPIQYSLHRCYQEYVAHCGKADISKLDPDRLFAEVIAGLTHLDWESILAEVTKKYKPVHEFVLKWLPAPSIRHVSKLRGKGGRFTRAADSVYEDKYRRPVLESIPEYLKRFNPDANVILEIVGRLCELVEDPLMELPYESKLKEYSDFKGVLANDRSNTGRDIEPLLDGIRTRLGTYTPDVLCDLRSMAGEDGLETVLKKCKELVRQGNRFPGVILYAAKTIAYRLKHSPNPSIIGIETVRELQDLLLDAHLSANYHESLSGPISTCLDALSSLLPRVVGSICEKFRRLNDVEVALSTATDFCEEHITSWTENETHQIQDSIQIQAYFRLHVYRLTLLLVRQKNVGELVRIINEMKAPLPSTELQAEAYFEPLRQYRLTIQEAFDTFSSVVFESNEQLALEWTAYTGDRKLKSLYDLMKKLANSELSPKELEDLYFVVYLEAIFYIPNTTAAEFFNTEQDPVQESQLRQWKANIRKKTGLLDIFAVLEGKDESSTVISRLKQLMESHREVTLRLEHKLQATMDLVKGNKDALEKSLNFLGQCDGAVRSSGDVLETLNELTPKFLLQVLGMDQESMKDRKSLLHGIQDILKKLTDTSSYPTDLSFERHKQTVYYVLTEYFEPEDWEIEDYEVLFSLLKSVQSQFQGSRVGEFLEEIGEWLFVDFKRKCMQGRTCQELETCITALHSVPHGNVGFLSSVTKFRILSTFSEMGEPGCVWNFTYEFLNEFGVSEDSLPVSQFLLCHLLDPALEPSHRSFLCRLIASDGFSESLLTTHRVHSTDTPALIRHVFELNSSKPAGWILNSGEQKYWEALVELEKNQHDLETLQSILTTVPSDHWELALRVIYMKSLFTKLSVACEAAPGSSRRGLLQNFNESRSFALLQGAEEEWTTTIRHMLAPLEYFKVPEADLGLILKYSHHIPIEQFDTVITSRFPPDWLQGILMARIQTALAQLDKNLLEQFSSLHLHGTFSSETPGHRILEFLDIFGDILNQEIKANSVTSLTTSKLKTIFEVHMKQPLDMDLLTSLRKTDSFSSWDLIFRKSMYVHSKGLSDTDAVSVLELEKNIDPNIMEAFIGAVVERGTIASLPQYLEKLRTEEWFLDTSVINMLAARPGLSIEKILKEAMEEHVGEKREGHLLIQKMKTLTMNRWLVLAEKLDPMLECLRRIRNRSEAYRNWTEPDFKSWVAGIKSRVATEGKSCIFTNLDEVLATVNAGIVLLEKPNKPDFVTLYDTQLLSVLIYMDKLMESRTLETCKGRLGEISTGEGKTWLTAAAAAAMALCGETIDLMSSNTSLAESFFNKTAPLFRLFQIGVSLVGDADYQKESDKYRRDCFGHSVVIGDLPTFMTASLLTVFLKKELLGGRVATIRFIDEVDSTFVDELDHRLYMSHPIPELRYLGRSVLLPIWEVVARNGNRTIEAVEEHFKRAQLKTPKFLRGYVSAKLPLYVRNAFEAKREETDNSYTVMNERGRAGKVTIMDNNKGEEQLNLQLSGGHQQFLQFRHGDDLSGESPMAVFTSNYAYFTEFQGLTFGVTGTLGKERDLFGPKYYNMECFKIPRYLSRRVLRQPSCVFPNKEEWVRCIFETVKDNVPTRPVLIVCVNISHVKFIEKRLRELIDDEVEGCVIDKDKIVVYFSSFDKTFQERVNGGLPFEAGETVIGSNIAGRGTDFHISPECHEGLLVIGTFLAGSDRGERQWDGRAARNGKPGSTKVIIYTPTGITDLELLKGLRDELYRRNLDEIKDLTPRILLEQRLLWEYFQYRKGLEGSKERSAQLGSGKVRETRLAHLQNRWAFWLDSMNLQINDVSLDEKVIMDSFQSFQGEMNELIKAGGLTQSPIEFVQLSRAYEESGNVLEAVKVLDQAIADDPAYSMIPHYYKGIILLKLSKSAAKGLTNETGPGYEAKVRKLSRTHLKTAKSLLNQTVEGIIRSTSQLNMANGKLMNDTNFGVQAMNEQTLLLRHLRELTNVLGLPLSADTFTSVRTLIDPLEAKDIFKSLLGPGPFATFIKGYRLSGKVSVSQDLVLTLNGQTFKPSSSILSIVLAQVTRKVNAILASKEENGLLVTESTFEDMLPSPEKLWALLLEHNKLKDERSVPYIRINFSKARFDHFVSLGRIDQENIQPLKFILAKHKEKYFEPKILAPLGIDSQGTDRLQESLTASGLLNPCTEKVATVVVLKPAEEPDWVKENRNLVTFVTCAKVGGGMLSEKETVRLEEIPELSGSAVLELLLAEGLIKPHKVDWAGIPGADPEEKRTALRKAVSSLPELLQTHEKYHPAPPIPTKLIPRLKTKVGHLKEAMLKDSANDRYLSDISDALLVSVGQLKTVQKFQVDYTTLSSDYSTSNHPTEELAEFRLQSFERVPSISEYKTHWSPGAMAVCLLGVAQIMIGTALLKIAPNWGVGLISEGGSDLRFAMYSMYRKDFSWTSYGIHKAISVPASLLTAHFFAGAGGWSWSRIEAELGEEAFKAGLWRVGEFAFKGGLNILRDKALDWIRDYCVANGRGLIETVVETQFHEQLYAVFGPAGLAERIFTLSQGNGTAIGILRKNIANFSRPLSAIQKKFTKSCQAIASQIISKAFGKISGSLSKRGIHIHLSTVLEILNISRSLASSVAKLKAVVQESFTEFEAGLQKFAEFLEGDQNDEVRIEDETEANLAGFRRDCRVLQSNMRRDVGVAAFEHFKTALYDEELRTEAQQIIVEATRREHEKRLAALKEEFEEAIPKSPILDDLIGPSADARQANPDHITLSQAKAELIENVAGESEETLREAFGEQVVFYKDKFGRHFAFLETGPDSSPELRKLARQKGIPEICHLNWNE